MTNAFIFRLSMRDDGRRMKRERQAGSSDYRRESGSYLDAVARISTKDWLPDFQGNDWQLYGE